MCTQPATGVSLGSGTAAGWALARVAMLMSTAASEHLGTIVRSGFDGRREGASLLQHGGGAGNTLSLHPIEVAEYGGGDTRMPAAQALQIL